MCESVIDRECYPSALCNVKIILSSDSVEFYSSFARLGRLLMVEVQAGRQKLSVTRLDLPPPPCTPVDLEIQ